MPISVEYVNRRSLRKAWLVQIPLHSLRGRGTTVVPHLSMAATAVPETAAAAAALIGGGGIMMTVTTTVTGGEFGTGTGIEAGTKINSVTTATGTQDGHSAGQVGTY
jgi:hypothetical protein